ncbi:MAG: hypothetical protein OHK0029_25680 [Armatimonadaceae bacterium]
MLTKKRRDTLIAAARQRDDWEVGFLDEVWFSRLAQPNLSVWTPAQSRLSLFEKELPAEEKTADAVGDRQSSQLSKFFSFQLGYILLGKLG